MSDSKVVHVFGIMNRGGAELRTLETARRVSGVRHTYVTLTGRRGELAGQIVADGSLVRPCRLSPAFPVKFLRLLRQERPDVVVSNVATFSGAILLLSRLAGVSRRVAIFRSDGDKHGNTIRRRAQRGLMRGLLAISATDIVGNAPGSLRFGLPRRVSCDARTAVLPDGVELRARPTAVIGIDGPRRLVHIARPLASKRRPRAVEILAAARRAGLDCRLQLVGAMAPEEFADLRRLADELSVRAFVEIVGPTDDVTSLLRSAHALVVTSTREGLPGVVMEALATGCPVVSTNLPGVAFVARHCRGVTMLDPAAPDSAWVAALEVMESPASPTRDDIWKSFRDSPFNLSVAALEVGSLWRLP